MKFFRYFFTLIFLLSFNLFSQEKKISKRIYTTKKLVNKPVIDGFINDEAWNVVEWSSDFTQKDPD